MKKILFAEDDQAIQEVVSMILQDDYIVTIYPEAKAIFNNHFELPDLFLLDKQLAGIDGLEVCRYLKNQDITRDIPVIIITASHNIEKLAMLAGADDVIAKPFSIKSLRKKIAAYI